MVLVKGKILQNPTLCIFAMFFSPDPHLDLFVALLLRIDGGCLGI